MLQAKYTGGTVLHLYMGERLSSADACRTLVRASLGDEVAPAVADAIVQRAAGNAATSTGRSRSLLGFGPGS